LAAIQLQTQQQRLRDALTDLRAGRRDAAAAAAGRAIQDDARCGVAWHILAICNEQAGDFTTALGQYEQALTLMPQEPEIANDLGRVALKMGKPDIAAQLFEHYVRSQPESVEGLNNLACAQRDLQQFDLAIETLKGAIAAHPDRALLWNCLAAVLTLQGRMQEALVFYDEALRLDPEQGPAFYNRSMARLALGDAAGALEDLDAAAALGGFERERASLDVLKAKTLLATGALEAGWTLYEARFDPHYEDFTHFAVDLPSWEPETPLAAARLLLIGEQGLGDEVLFAHLVPDMVDAVGPDGALALAVEPRLVDLFQRSFPGVEVGAHASGRVNHIAVRTAPFAHGREQDFDAYAPLGAPLARFRSSLDRFKRQGFLKADPDRVAHWRGRLAARPGRKVGVLWKSLVMNADRLRYFAPFEAWEPVLRTPGVSFVNLQYGDSGLEAEIARGWDVDLWTPDGVDLMRDLDDVAALTAGLDLTMGPANASTNIAAACGSPVWLISFPFAWPRLGQAHYPWYPQARVFDLKAHGQWDPTMAEIAEALAEWTTVQA
jgi:tetratricopeptide (TPR) repeat protein